MKALKKLAGYRLQNDMSNTGFSKDEPIQYVYRSSKHA